MKCGMDVERCANHLEVLVERCKAEAEGEEPGVQLRPRLFAALEHRVEALLELTKVERHRASIAELCTKLAFGLAEPERLRTRREASGVVRVVPGVEISAATPEVVAPRGDGGLRLPEPSAFGPLERGRPQIEQHRAVAEHLMEVERKEIVTT